MVGERGQRADLCRAVQAEMVADAVEAGHRHRRPEGVADPRPGHAMRLGEGAEADHPRVLHVDPRQRLLGEEIGIGLVEEQQRARRQVIEHRLDPPRRLPRAHRVVRIGEIDEPRPGPGRAGDKAVRVLGVVAVGHLVQHAAEARDMVVEGRIGAVRGHHRLARGEEQSHREAEQPVDALARHDLRRCHAMTRGQRGAQLVAVGVAVFPRLGHRRPHRLDGPRRGAEAVLVGAEPGAAQEVAAQLERLGPGEGHRRRQAGGDRGEAQAVHGPSEAERQARRKGEGGAGRVRFSAPRRTVWPARPGTPRASLRSSPFALREFSLTQRQGRRKDRRRPAGTGRLRRSGFPDRTRYTGALGKELAGPRPRPPRRVTRGRGRNP